MNFSYFELKYQPKSMHSTADIWKPSSRLSNVLQNVLRMLPFRVTFPWQNFDIIDSEKSQSTATDRMLYLLINRQFWLIGTTLAIAVHLKEKEEKN